MKIPDCKIKSAIPLVLVLFFSVTSAQEGIFSVGSRSSWAFQIEAGIPTQDLKPSLSRYRLFIAGGSVYFPLYRTEKPFNLGLELFPHLAAGKNGPGTEYEAGLNFRLCFNYAIKKRQWISFKAGIGPHYITIEANRQASGFVFSDYFLLSYKISFPKANRNPGFFEVYAGSRHLSSAGIRQPSDGFNHVIIGLGIGRVIQGKK